MKNDCVHIGSQFSKLRVKSMKTLKIQGFVLAQTPLIVAISMCIVLKL